MSQTRGKCLGGFIKSLQKQHVFGGDFGFFCCIMCADVKVLYLEIEVKYLCGNGLESRALWYIHERENADQC